MVDEQLQTAFDQAKIKLICRPDSVFITTVLFSLKFKWDNSISTACTNGIELKVNPKFFMDLDVETRIFILAHEAWHVAFQHMLRVSSRNFRQWNYATDYVINLMLKDTGFKVEPNKWLLDEKYRGMSSYEVYDALSSVPPEQLPNCPDDMEEVEGTPEQIKEIEEAITNTVITAGIRTKMAGQHATIPGEIEIFLDNLVKPQLPWPRLLARLLNGLKKTGYSFRKPNMRYCPTILPGMVAESIGDIAVAVDLSGSITQKQANVFISEIHSIHRTLKPDNTRIIGFDTGITCTFCITETADVTKLKFIGGGGTRIGPVYDWTKQHKPRALVIFTDGHFNLLPEEIPAGMILIWVIHDNPSFKTPKGKVVYYKNIGAHSGNHT